jgi:hypothetical protein
MMFEEQTKGTVDATYCTTRATGSHYHAVGLTVLLCDSYNWFGREQRSLSMLARWHKARRPKSHTSARLVRLIAPILSTEYELAASVHPIPPQN